MEVIETEKLTRIEQRVSELMKWWISKAEDEVKFVAPKAVEYGSSDLRVMGEAMRGLLRAAREHARSGLADATPVRRETRDGGDTGRGPGAASVNRTGHGDGTTQSYQGNVQQTTLAEGMEMACAFYALGKVARLFGAFERGEIPNIDSWKDLGIYCRMAEHVREFGKWV